MYFADLHIHTRVSDGSENAEEIIKKAKAAGVTHLSFTDHDTTEMAEENCHLARQYGICAIPGVEMSAFDMKKGKKVHILGFGYVRTNYIEQIGQETLEKRNRNCLKQMEILETLGYAVPIEEIQKFAGKCIYKQHILDYLVQTGQSESMFGKVYQTIFKNSGPCDFDIAYPEADDVVRAIKADGGYAVLAHPGQQKNYAVIHRLVQAGLDGIEYRHPSHTQADRKRVAEYAKSYRLIQTGGSDFHGKYEKKSASVGAFPAEESSRRLFEGWEK